MSEKRRWNVATQAYCKQALFGIRGNDRKVVIQSQELWPSTFMSLSGTASNVLGGDSVLPLMADDVGVMGLFLAWAQGSNPGQGVAPAHYFVNDHLRQCEAVTQACVQAFLRDGDCLPEIDNDVVALAYRFIRARSGVLTEVDEKTVADSVALVNRAMAFNDTRFLISTPLFDAQANPLRLLTTLSRDTVWMTVRRTEREMDTVLFMSLLVSFIFLKRDGRDPFNQLRYIGMFNPWTDTVVRWDMQDLHPGEYNTLIDAITC